MYQVLITAFLSIGMQENRQDESTQMARQEPCTVVLLRTGRHIYSPNVPSKTIADDIQFFDEVVLIASTVRDANEVSSTVENMIKEK